MRIFGLSITRNRCPEVLSEGDFSAVSGEVQRIATRLSELDEVIDNLRADSATFNTAINRIERKQNRWLDVLNLKDVAPLPDGNGDKSVATAPAARRLPQVGEEEEA